MKDLTRKCGILNVNFLRYLIDNDSIMREKENLGRGGTEGYSCGNKWTEIWREKGLKGNLGEEGSEVGHPCGERGLR